MSTVVGWVEPSPEFGAAWEHGSCNAIVEVPDGPFATMVCGWPRKEDGTCAKGHKPPDVSPPA